VTLPVSIRSVTLVLLLLAVSRANAATQQVALPEITSHSDTSWHDLGFRIQQLETLPNGAQLLRVAGSYRGAPVGLGLLLGPSWKEGRLGADVPLVIYSGTVDIRSLGEQSDRFLAALDELYGTKQRAKRMGARTAFTAISLGGDPAHLRAAPVKLKLFFESDDESRYAELYLNIDVSTGTVELAEKDPDYRTAIVRALGAR
jgi:hypothetical protein